MTLQEVIAMADELKPNAFSPSVKVAWINALEGRIALSVFLMSEADAAQLHYTTEDLNETLLVKPPYDDIYELWLEAKIDYANGEYDKYQNTMAEYNAHYGEFVRWFAEKYRPAQPHCGRARLPEYYISAYSLAVNAGFAGTLEEWLQSLHGRDGVDGTVGAVFYPQVVNGVLSWTNEGGYENPAPVNIAGPGEKGDKGDTGATGAAGISPIVSVTTISNGHRITIIDATHPAENPLVFDVIDGAGSGDMKASVYDSDSSVANAGGISAYVAAHAPSVTVDETPTSGSSNPVSSGGTYTAVHATKPMTEGGTGATNGANGLYNLINAAGAISSSEVADGDYVGVNDVSAATSKKITFADLKSLFNSASVSIQGLTTSFTLSNDDCSAAAVVCGNKALVIVNIAALYDTSTTTHDFKIYGVIADNPNTTCGWLAIPDGALSVKLRPNGSNYSTIRVSGIDSNTGNAVGTVFFTASVV